MSLQHFPLIVESIKNGSPPDQVISDTQASILDFILFPGFSRMSAAIREHLNIDITLYIPLLCFLGLFAFLCKRTFKSLSRWLEIHCTSTVHLQYRDDAYNMFMLWISSQSFSQHARSSLVTTDLGTSLNRFRHGRSDNEDADEKTLHYTPWNGRFLMWYKGQPLMFRREQRASELFNREEVSISCLFRSPQILKELISECCAEYAKLVQDKTALYEHQDGIWVKSEVADKRDISTVILNDNQKKGLLNDIEDFLDLKSQKWYFNRGIPYRKGYLLHGPPGTGKSSLSFALAGVSGLNIYILSLSTVTEVSLRNLFAKLPSRCVILLEDVDAVSSNRSETENSPQMAQMGTSSLSNKSKSIAGQVSLSTLLNVIDGVASQEGRILIMTTNYIERLDKALIRPGRIDRTVELGLADKKMTAQLFCIVFNPVEGDITPRKDTQSDLHEAARSKVEEVQRIELLANEFSTMVPEMKFSPAAILSYLLEHRKSPVDAINNVGQLVPSSIDADFKRSAPKDAMPQNAQVESARISKWDEKSSTTEVPTDMVQIPIWQPNTPPSSPVQSQSKVTNISDFEVVSSPFVDFLTSGSPEKNDVLTHDTEGGSGDLRFHLLTSADGRVTC